MSSKEDLPGKVLNYLKKQDCQWVKMDHLAKHLELAWFNWHLMYRILNEFVKSGKIDSKGGSHDKARQVRVKNRRDVNNVQ